MKLIKYFALSLVLINTAYGVRYTQEQAQETIEMLNTLPLNAQCAQASAAILAAPNAILTQQEKDSMRAQIKLFAENLVKYHAFLADVKNKDPKQLEKIKELLQN